MRSSGADSGRHSSALDSRTVPHPEWTQISGQIERTSTVGPNNGDASVGAIIRLSEGAHVAVDFGTAVVSSFRQQMDDFIRVRGQAIEKEGQVIVIGQRQNESAVSGGRIVHVAAFPVDVRDLKEGNVVFKADSIEITRRQISFHCLTKVLLPSRPVELSHFREHARKTLPLRKRNTFSGNKRGMLANVGTITPEQGDTVYGYPTRRERICFEWDWPISPASVERCGTL